MENLISFCTNEHSILCSNYWQNLLQLLTLREQKLRAAGEIHRFHRDIAEAIFRIQDKNAALSTEMGKDLNSALALHRKHEGFENDLVALEAQLQVHVKMILIYYIYVQRGREIH